MNTPLPKIYCLGNVHSADWANIFIKDLCRGFVELGADAHFAILGRDQDPREDFNDPRHSFFVDLNARLLIDDHPRFSLIVDNPLLHPHLASLGPLTRLGMIDAGHAEITGYSKASACFVPHGGPELENGFNDRDRDIDVLFVGNIAEEHHPANILEELALKAGRKVAFQCQDPLHQLLQDLSASGVATGSLRYEHMTFLLDLCTTEAQRLARIAAITSVRNASFHVFGLVPDAILPRLCPNAVIHGLCKFEITQQWMRRSKVVINIAQKFPRGSHERIWYAMASGCAVITNRSQFVEQDFTHGENILFYDDPHQVGELVETALAHGRGRAMAACAAPIYSANHTWSERAERILRAMRGMA